ncbi:biotin synthase BioB [Candidatus Nitrosacidococcus sp. I8]|uniref:biotin synthase BioB n=1 Tax=Candidatus Nitrosacidococcus sp. I8 TaxID=2942908 RepID=UPI002226E906|nr:biotin synthase BioB [Candidatus Nitrosacidococcus sp. I8]CAH9019375.1 Biotin synthase [Candidatus Nitrosacidococcus sp. I8]
MDLSSSPTIQSQLRHDWTIAEILNLFEIPFTDLLYQAHTVHRQYFDPNQIQASTLLSIKTGGCPEDCAYCPQSVHHQTSVESEPLLSLNQVVEAATQAKAQGAGRFCMGAAWRSPKEKSLEKIIGMIKEVKTLGLETCVTLGMLAPGQAEQLKAAGLDYYNHNLDTSPEFYEEIITTRTYQDRLDTLAQVREAGIHVCCGGIVGMGEERSHRAGLLASLANLPYHPESVPINQLVKVAGTPLANAPSLDPFEFVRTVACARILMPQSFVRLSAGRETMSDELQALCFFAGANSLFCGDKLLTTPNPEMNRDQQLLKRLGLAFSATKNLEKTPNSTCQCSASLSS